MSSEQFPDNFAYFFYEKKNYLYGTVPVLYVPVKIIQ